MWAVYKKELKSYFLSPIGYIVIGILLKGITSPNGSCTYFCCCLWFSLLYLHMFPWQVFRSHLKNIIFRMASGTAPGWDGRISNVSLMPITSKKFCGIRCLWHSMVWLQDFSCRYCWHCFWILFPIKNFPK